jgi:uncharacterized protein YbjT (DUF2867 family)
MRVCVVGASGKLGQYMVRHALDRGELIHEAPAIVGCRTPSALAQAGRPVGHGRPSEAVKPQGS